MRMLTRRDRRREPAVEALSTAELLALHERFLFPLALEGDIGPRGGLVLRDRRQFEDALDASLGAVFAAHRAGIVTHSRLWRSSN